MSLKNNLPGWFIRVFLTGLITILPLVATVTVLIILGGVIYDWLGPNSYFGKAVSLLGFGGWDGSEYIRYFVGLLIIIALIFGMGLLAERGLQRGLQKLVDSIVLRIPIVKSLYETMSHFVGLLAKKKDSKMEGMSPVWCYFGGAEGVVLLGILSTPNPVVINGRKYFSVIIPTAPVPVGGAVFFVPEASIVPASVGIEGLTSIYVSMGATTPQILGNGNKNK